jgi:hypothetical protein
MRCQFVLLRLVLGAQLAEVAGHVAVDQRCLTDLRIDQRQQRPGRAHDEPGVEQHGLDGHGNPFRNGSRTAFVRHFKVRAPVRI